MHDSYLPAIIRTASPNLHIEPRRRSNRGKGAGALSLSPATSRIGPHPGTHDRGHTPAPVAQWIEQAPSKRLAAGSSPAGGATDCRSEWRRFRRSECVSLAFHVNRTLRLRRGSSPAGTGQNRASTGVRPPYVPQNRGRGTARHPLGTQTRAASAPSSWGSEAAPHAATSGAPLSREEKVGRPEVIPLDDLAKRLGRRGVPRTERSVWSTAGSALLR